MDPRKHFSALNIIHKIIRERVQPGDLCIDATAGRGNDALFLAELVGETGHVTAFDIQQDAVDSTKKLLDEHGMTSRTDVLLKSHSEMDEICEEGTVSCITFNFGWLPKGDHNIFTNKSTSIPAIEKGLKGFILKASKQLKDGHSLIYLCRKASAYNDDFEPYFKDCAYVNQFYIESRYPADVPEALTKQDAKQCLSIAERVLALCEQEDMR